MKLHQWKVAVMTLALLTTGAKATSICRWVNEAGQTQITEVVPEKYRSAAICTDSQKYELSDEQRRAVEQQRAEAKAQAQARQAAATLLNNRAPSASRPAQAASQSSVKRPTEIVTDTTDCATWWRIYEESVACFGPYRTLYGATKSEGFERCNIISSPVLKCGPQSN